MPAAGGEVPRGEGAEGVGGGRGGRGGARGSRKPEGEKREDQPPRERDDGDYIMEPAERDFDEAMRFGIPTEYQPDLTPDHLKDFLPGFPSQGADGSLAVKRRLAELATGDPMGIPQNFTAEAYVEDLEATGSRYFADARSRERAEALLQRRRLDEARAKAEAEGKELGEVSGEPIIRDLDQDVRQVIVDAAVAGKHDKMAYSADTVGIARTWHTRSETWGTSKAKIFEDKVAQLVSGKGGKLTPRAMGRKA